MIIREVKIQGFRNLPSYGVCFHPRRNLIHGVNGAGKTSILEAIFLTAFGKSFLSGKKSEMVKHGCDEFAVHLTAEGEGGLNRMSSIYRRSFSLYLDRKKSTIFEINGYVYPVFFSSSDYGLYIESKPYTRKMIDRFLFGVDPLYIRAVLCYNRALRQKNHLLKLRCDISELRSWNKILSEQAEQIVRKKMDFIDGLNRQLTTRFNRELSLSYQPSLDLDRGLTAELIFRQLESVGATELKYRRSVLGPHRDGFDIRLGDRPLRIHSSGEKKIHLLMIYIAFIELFREVRNQYPVFLLDDYDTAIDARNIDFLVESYPEMQVIATSVNTNAGFDQRIELEKEN